MAQFTKRKISLNISWDKNNPSDLTYLARCEAFVPDDTKEGGEEQVSVATGPTTITRAQFRGLTGLQIQTQVLNEIDAALQALGSGAGGHTLVDDLGDLS